MFKWTTQTFCAIAVVRWLDVHGAHTQRIHAYITAKHAYVAVIHTRIIVVSVAVTSSINSKQSKKKTKRSNVEFQKTDPHVSSVFLFTRHPTHPVSTLILRPREIQDTRLVVAKLRPRQLYVVDSSNTK